MTRPTPKQLSVAMDDGRELDMAIRRPPDAEAIGLRAVEPIGPHTFERCPICEDEANTDEHVPPAAAGGRVMTAPVTRATTASGRTSKRTWSTGSTAR